MSKTKGDIGINHIGIKRFNRIIKAEFINKNKELLSCDSKIFKIKLMQYLSFYHRVHFKNGS